MNEIKTDRLKLRRWVQSDVKALADLNADPEVMRYFPKLSTYEETEQMVLRIEDFFEQNGFGFWAVEIKNECAGFIGLGSPRVPMPYGPCVEIGWRLAKKFWGKGYATEGAKACLADGFQRLGLKEIVSFTATTNIPSMKVMEKIGMKRSHEHDFLHPSVPVGHPLQPHVLYRLSQEDWALLQKTKP